MFSGLLVLGLISELSSFLGMEESSHLRKKIRNVGSIKIINSEVALLTGWMEVPASLGAPVPKTVFIVSIQH